MTREDAIRKIKALMALATSSNENEATQALSAARKLMIKHQVDDESISTPEMVVRQIPFISTRIQTWETVLANAIALHFNTRLTYCKGPNVFYIYGSQLETEIACHAIEGTRNRLLQLVEESKSLRRPDENPKAFRTSWLFGAANSIAHKLQHVEVETAQQNNAETALVLVRGQAAAEFLARTVPNVTRTNLDLSFSSPRGFSDGYTTGKSISIQAGIEG